MLFISSRYDYFYISSLKQYIHCGLRPVLRLESLSSSSLWLVMLIYLAHKMFSFTENPRENWPTQAYLENDVKIEVHAACNCE